MSLSLIAGLYKTSQSNRTDPATILKFVNEHNPSFSQYEYSYSSNITICAAGCIQAVHFICTEGGCGDNNFGWDYTGTVNRTASGNACQRWDSQTPYSHYMTDASKFPDDSLDETSNYCRQYPGVNHGYLWCHTTNPSIRWEHCSLDETLCGEYRTYH